MKKTMFFVAIATMFMLSSCGAFKKSPQQTYYPQYGPQQTQQTTQPQRVATPEVTTTELSSCEKALLEESTNMRGMGSYKTYAMQAAIKLCERGARASIAERIKTAVMSASESYLKQTQANDAVDMEMLDEVFSQEFCQNMVGGLKHIAIDKKPNSDGTFQYSICFEMDKTKAAVAEEAAQQLIDNIPAEVEQKVMQDKDSFKSNLAKNMTLMF